MVKYQTFFKENIENLSFHLTSVIVYSELYPKFYVSHLIQVILLTCFNAKTAKSPAAWKNFFFRLHSIHIRLLHQHKKALVFEISVHSRPNHSAILRMDDRWFSCILCQNNRIIKNNKNFCVLKVNN